METNASPTTTEHPDDRLDPSTRSARRRRRALRFGGIALAASSLLGGLAGTASAESPPAEPPPMVLTLPPVDPTPDLPLADAPPPPPAPNPHHVHDFAKSTGDTWGDLTFTSTASSVVVQISPIAPTYSENGTPTMAGANPQHVYGTLDGGLDQLVNGQPEYHYAVGRTGLVPGTTYYVLVAMHGGPEQTTNYFQGSFTTKRRYVQATPIKVNVIDDSDGFLKGAGEISFATRVAPDNDGLAFSDWGSWSPEYKIASGESKNFGPWLSHQTETKLNNVVVQVQGKERDKGIGSCPWEGGEFAPMQWSDKCWDVAYATAGVYLPTGKYEGVQSQYVWAQVSRDPALQFDVLVKVDVWYE